MEENKQNEQVTEEDIQDAKKEEAKQYIITLIKKPWVFASIIIVLVAIIIAIASSTSSSSSIKLNKEQQKNYDQKAIGIAQQLIRSDLKNPSSAIWNDVHVELSDDYYRYVVYVDVSAQNGFGGYTRDQYYVGFRIDKNGETFYYSPYLYCVNATSFFTAETAKNMFFEDWGEPVIEE